MNKLKSITGFLKKDNFLYPKILALLCVLYFPIFLNLGGLYIMVWDESRVADSSYEMLHGKNIFVVTFNNQPDIWAVKPPLLNWIQAISIAIFGFNEMSVRLPSAFAGFFICLLLVYFTKKKFNSYSLGAIASLILLTAEGFIGDNHSIRSADYDAMLTFFVFVGSICFLLYNENPKKIKLLFLTFLFFMLAVLTKGPGAGMFFLPGLFIYCLIKKNLLLTLKNKWFYFSFLVLLFIVGSVYLLRDHYSPGYLEAFNTNEFLGRYDSKYDMHLGTFWFNLDYFVNSRFMYWCYLIPLGWLVGFFSKNKFARTYSLFSFIIGISYFIIISSIKNKGLQYDLPIYPLLALQVGIFVFEVLQHIVNLLLHKLWINHNFIYYSLIAYIFFYSYSQTVSNAFFRVYPISSIGYNHIQYYLKFEKEVIKNSKIITNGYFAQSLFYCYKLNAKGFNIHLETSLSEYKPNDKIIIDNPDLEQLIEQKYSFELLDEHWNLKVYKILNKR